MNAKLWGLPSLAFSVTEVTVPYVSTFPFDRIWWFLELSLGGSGCAIRIVVLTSSLTDWRQSLEAA